MKSRRSYALAIFLALLVAASFPTLTNMFVQAQVPVVTTTQPLYTLRDKEVALSGSGFASGTTYNVWLRRAGDNATRFTGIAFAPASGGLVPPSTVVQLKPDDPLGTYLVSVSTSPTIDTALAQAHFGVWGTIRALYQRTETVTILGGGLFPGGGAKLTVRNPAGTFVHDATVLANERGEFKDEWRIPADSALDVYSVFVDGTGIFDDATREFVSLAKFTVAPATLRVGLVTQPAGSYERTQTASLVLEVKYPDASPVTSLKAGTTPLNLIQDTSTVASLNLTRLDPGLGTWRGEFKVPANATLGTGYRFRLPNGGFDDGFGNTGGSNELLSNLFEIASALFRIEAATNQSSYQIGFDAIKIVTSVKYPDGTPLLNGTVIAVISSGTWTAQVPLTYDNQTGTWTGVYSISLLDVAKIGSWRITVQARDQFANAGQTTILIAVQPFMFASLLIGVLIVLLLVRWLLRRYWRRISLQIKRLTLSIRKGRIKPSGLAYSFIFPS